MTVFFSFCLRPCDTGSRETFLKGVRWVCPGCGVDSSQLTQNSQHASSTPPTVDPKFANLSSAPIERLLERFPYPPCRPCCPSFLFPPSVKESERSPSYLMLGGVSVRSLLTEARGTSVSSFKMALPMPNAALFPTAIGGKQASPFCLRDLFARETSRTSTALAGAAATASTPAWTTIIEARGAVFIT